MVGNTQKRSPKLRFNMSPTVLNIGYAKATSQVPLFETAQCPGEIQVLHSPAAPAAALRGDFGVLRGDC